MGRLLRARWIPGGLIVLLAVLVCLRLGWWQWDRTREADGTLQNLAYAVLWPAFGASFIYMWWRFVTLEESKDVDDDAELDTEIAQVLAADAPVDGTVARVGADSGADEADEADDGGGDGENGDATVTEGTPGYSYFVGTVEDADDDDDPELAAYNRALAALAEEDRRSAG